MTLAMGRIEPSGFRGGDVGGGGGDLYEEGPAIGKGKEEEEEEDLNWCSSSATSSIGRNSDLSERSTTVGGGGDDDGDGDDNEVQSAYNGPMDIMNSLEEVLPIRRGISSFYNGKSKSFTSLAEAATSTSSVKDIAKQDNAYSRRRRNLLAINHIWGDKNRSSPHRSSNGYGILSKRPLSSSRSSLALAVAMSSSESLSSSASDDSNSNSRSPTPLLPPLHPRSRPAPWRSHSVADFQQCRAEATTNA